MFLIAQALALAPDLKPGTPFVYILRLQSGGLYVGCSTDYETRLREHQNGTACRATKLDPPTSAIDSEFETEIRRLDEFRTIDKINSFNHTVSVSRCGIKSH